VGGGTGGAAGKGVVSGRISGGFAVGVVEIGWKGLDYDYDYDYDDKPTRPDTRGSNYPGIPDSSSGGSAEQLFGNPE
jgi:hypothetical protein